MNALKLLTVFFFVVVVSYATGYRIGEDQPGVRGMHIGCKGNILTIYAEKQK